FWASCLSQKGLRRGSWRCLWSTRFIRGRLVSRRPERQFRGSSSAALSTSQARQPKTRIPPVQEAIDCPYQGEQRGEIQHQAKEAIVRIGVESANGVDRRQQDMHGFLQVGHAAA